MFTIHPGLLSEVSFVCSNSMLPCVGDADKPKMPNKQMLMIDWARCGLVYRLRCYDFEKQDNQWVTTPKLKSVHCLIDGLPLTRSNSPLPPKVWGEHKSTNSAQLLENYSSFRAKVPDQCSPSSIYSVVQWCARFGRDQNKSDAMGTRRRATACLHCWLNDHDISS